MKPTSHIPFNYDKKVCDGRRKTKTGFRPWDYFLLLTHRGSTTTLPLCSLFIVHVLGLIAMDEKTQKAVELLQGLYEIMLSIHEQKAIVPEESFVCMMLVIEEVQRTLTLPDLD